LGGKKRKKPRLSSRPKSDLAAADGDGERDHSSKVKKEKESSYTRIKEKNPRWEEPRRRYKFPRWRNGKRKGKRVSRGGVKVIRRDRSIAIYNRRRKNYSISRPRKKEKENRRSKAGKGNRREKKWGSHVLSVITRKGKREP